MPARYHPLYDGLWNDDAFDPQGDLAAAPFEERAFFAFLCSNQRLRPSGIYRATDDQLAIDSTLPLPRVKRYLTALETRSRIVRDGAWVFIRGYFARQPKGPNLILAVRDDLFACSSGKILKAFCAKYAAHQQLFDWSADRLATIGQPLPDLPPTVKGRSNELAPQSRAVQSSTEQSRAVDRRRPRKARTVAHATEGPNGLGPAAEMADHEAKKARALDLLKRAGLTPPAGEPA